MSDSETLYRVDVAGDSFAELRPVHARALDLKEKDIEKSVVGQPEILFTEPEAVVIIANVEPFTFSTS